MDNVDYLKKRLKFFLYIFAIHSSSRHEKRCQMSVRLFSLFQGSRNQQCSMSIFPIDAMSWLHPLSSRVLCLSYIATLLNFKAFKLASRLLGVTKIIYFKEMYRKTQTNLFTVGLTPAYYLVLRLFHHIGIFT